MARDSVLRWGDRVRWALVGGLVLAAPALGLWVFLGTFPRMKGTKRPPVLEDAAWLKHRRTLDLDNLWSRPSWLRGRIRFAHGLDYWLECRDAAPVVTATVRGRYSDSELRLLARHAASLAFLTFRGAKRSLTLHLWNERPLSGGRLEVRHCVASLTVTLRDAKGSTDFEADCKATVTPSAFVRDVAEFPGTGAVGY